jgi:hypothetical protein
MILSLVLVIGSVQSFSHIWFLLSCVEGCWVEVALQCDLMDHAAKRSGDGHDFGEPVHLQVSFRAPLGCRDVS